MVERTGLLAQWHSLVSDAEQAAGVKLDEELESYLVFTLMRYLSRPEMVQRVLALDYLQAAHSQGRDQQTKLRDVGDQCLLFSGLFPRRAERRRVRVSYYVDLGRSAYRHLGHTRDPLSSLYADLSYAFVSAMDILQAVRNMREEQQLDPLNALELWQDTGSAMARRTLSETSDATPLADPATSQKPDKSSLH